MLYCRGSATPSHLIRLVDAKRVLRSQVCLRWRQYSLFRDLFQQEVPVDKQHVAVSLFDKESVLQDFTKNLNTLLSRENAEFGDCVAFLKKAEYPPEEVLPSLSSYNSASIIKLLDALTYLSHHRITSNYCIMLDLVASELSKRTLLQTGENDIRMLMDCITCLSRIVEPSKPVRILIHNVNKEIRSNAKYLINRGQYVEVLSSLSHILHPSVIDLVVHTCCCECDKLTACDLSQFPRLLTKFKVAHERVVSSILTHVSKNPSVTFDSDTGLCRNFLSDVAHMPYMENGDGHITEKPLTRLSSLILKGLTQYSENEMLFILFAIPSPGNIPSEAVCHYSGIVLSILEHFGVLVKADDGFGVNTNLTAVLSSMKEPQLLAVTDATTRFDIFQDDIKTSAVMIQNAILVKEPMVELSVASKLNVLLGNLLTEITVRMEKALSQGRRIVGPDEEKCEMLKGINIMLPIIRLIDRIQIDGSSGTEEKIQRLLVMIENEIKAASGTSLQSFKYFVNEVGKCGPLITRKLAKTLFLQLMSQAPDWDVPLKLMLRILRFSGLHVKDNANNDVVAVDYGFVKDAATHVIDVARNKLEIGIIGKRQYYETISYALLAIHRAVDRGFNASEVGTMISNAEKILMEGLKDSNVVITPKTLRNIMRLPSENQLRSTVDEMVVKWSQVRDTPGASTLTLEHGLVYILTACQMSLENIKCSSKELERVESVGEMATSLLDQFETAIDTHFSRSNYGDPGANVKDKHAWEATVGLRPLFRPPKEPLDIFMLTRMATLPNYFWTEQYKGLSHQSDASTSLFHLKRCLQRISAKYTAMELSLARDVNYPNGRQQETLVKWLDVLTMVNKSISRCLLAAEMATPAWPNTYLPRRHIQRLVTSALRRFSYAQGQKVDDIC